MIEFRDFTFSYGSGAEPALRGINLRIASGEFVLVSGPSGGGKSSLCRCINGLIPHFYGGKVSGKVVVDGMDVLNHSPRELATRVGMTFQDPENQLVTLSVDQEIAFGMENLGWPVDLIRKRLEESLDTIGIAHLRSREMHELSGGEKQKVAIAAVLALHPSILIMDEPTSELDPKGAEEVLSIVQRLNDELGLTVILVEHRIERVAHLVDRVILVSNGRIAADGSPREVLGSPIPHEIGIGVPPIVELAVRLHANGASRDHIPLTVKEGRPFLEARLKNGCSPQLREECRPKSGEPIIEVENLWYAYPSGPTALADVSLTFHRGEFAAIMGRNASGKSTLVKHFNGLLKPTRGSVRVNGRDTSKATAAELGRTVGFVFQNPNDHLFADTVEEEIALVLRNFGFPREETRERMEGMLRAFRLEHRRRGYPRYLSGGEKQRVALASVLAARPQVLVLDEPTRGMDHRLKHELMAYLEAYRREGNTVILVTHDVEMVARYVDRVILLSEGRIVVDGSRREVLSKALLFSPQINRLVQAFEKYGVPKDVLTVDELEGILQ